MSRIGKKLITLPEKVTAEIKDGSILIKGPKGELKNSIPDFVKITSEGNVLKLEIVGESGEGNESAMWGTVRSIVSNMAQGVSEGYEKKLEIEGVGYKAQLQGDTLVLSLGFSHPIEVKAPEGISFKMEKNSILISGVDKALVGKVASNIRKLKKPEPYKGKGIRYSGEIVRRKAGKKASAGTS
jgi:large subunit ribosomal protein L6